MIPVLYRHDSGTVKTERDRVPAQAKTMKRGRNFQLFKMFESSAIVSEDGRYRYCLTRVWDSKKPILYFVMLNPSTADADEDDPTIKKCVGFAKHNKFGGIFVVNLFALRATEPREMFLWREQAIGFENDEHILKIPRGATVCCAWGTTAHMYAWSQERIRGVKVILKSLGVRARCVNKSKTDKVEKPWHPLYVKYGELMPYSLEEA